MRICFSILSIVPNNWNGTCGWLRATVDPGEMPRYDFRFDVSYI